MMFYGLHHGKSQSNHHLREYVIYLFPSIEQANPSYLDTSNLLAWSFGVAPTLMDWNLSSSSTGTYGKGF